MADEAQAAPSAAPEALQVPHDAEGYLQWRMTGEIPEQPKKAESAAADAPKEEKSEAKSEAAAKPESETGGQEHKKGGKKSAEERIAQLTARTKELEARLEAASKPEATKANEKAEPAAKPQEKLEAPKKPLLKDFKSYDEYETAKDKYYEDLADYRAALKLAEFRQQQVQQAKSQELQTKLTDARARYENADAVIAPAAKSIMEDAQIPGVVKAMVDDSPVMIDLLYVLGSKAEELSQFVTLAKTQPLAAMRTVAAMEQMIQAELGKSEQNRGADGKFSKSEEKAPEKKETKAPPPEKVLGGGSPPADEAEAALKAGNFREFKRIENQRDLERRKGR